MPSTSVRLLRCSSHNGSAAFFFQVSSPLVFLTSDNYFIQNIKKIKDTSVLRPYPIS
jgi:hypothetical protein